MVTKKYILSQKRLPGQNTLAYYTKVAIAMSHGQTLASRTETLASFQL